MESGAPVVGILLAAGSGSRFGGGKLLTALDDGETIGERALANLTAAVDAVLAVVRPGDDALARSMAHGGARVTVCANAADGMGESLAWGVRAAPAVKGWVIALADMPWTTSDTIARIANALRGGALLVAPSHRGARGHPVAISARYFGDLCKLSGDEGARRILRANMESLTLIETDDPGVVRDVDLRSDL
jgi:molybdenum cofactor cytidylyltransferase